MKTHISKEKEPSLYAEIQGKVREQKQQWQKFDTMAGYLKRVQEETRDQQETIKRYVQQAAKVQAYLVPYIEKNLSENKTLIVEGVHLDPQFNQRMIAKYGDKCACFVITVNNAYEHIKRSQSRTFELTVNPGSNEYVENYQSIAAI